MKKDRLLGYGLLGGLIAMLGCFTPVLVVLLGGLGLSGLVGWIDYVLFPVLGLSIAIVVYAIWKRRSA